MMHEKNAAVGTNLFAQVALESSVRLKVCYVKIELLFEGRDEEELLHMFKTKMNLRFRMELSF